MRPLDETYVHRRGRQELTPVTFLERAGVVHARRTAIVDGAVKYTWAELRDRSRQLASALRVAGLRHGARVAFVALNSEPLLLPFWGSTGWRRTRTFEHTAQRKRGGVHP